MGWGWAAGRGPHIAWGCGGLFAVGFDDGVHATQWRCCCGQDLENGRLYPEVLLVKLGGHVLLVWAINWVAFIPNSGNPRTPCNEYRMSSTQFPHQQWWMKDTVDSWPQQKNCFFLMISFNNFFMSSGRFGSELPFKYRWIEFFPQTKKHISFMEQRSAEKWRIFVAFFHHQEQDGTFGWSLWDDHRGCQPGKRAKHTTDWYSTVQGGAS